MRAIIGKGLVGLVTVGVGSFAAVGAARADDPPSEIGIALTVGGGVEDFTGESMRNATAPAGTWEVRAAIGTRYAVTGELAYIGSASDIDAPIGRQDAVLVSTGAEALVRSNLFADGPWRPYAFLGVGWRRYTVTDADFRMSDTGMNDSDDVLAFPMGLGIWLRYHDVLVDARATFRGAVEEDLVVVDRTDTASGDYGTMHTWSISARLGYEF